MGGKFFVRRLAGAEVFGDGFGAGTDLEFAVNPADVAVDGVELDVEQIGDFLVEVTLG